MLRRPAMARTSFAATRIARDIEEADVRQGGARSLAAAGRILAAPFLVLAAALAGAIYVVLLPVCGIASIAEGIAIWCWSHVRDTVTHHHRDILPQD